MTDVAYTCGGCIFFSVSLMGSDQGQCWRYPPQCFPVMTPEPGKVLTPGAASGAPTGVAVAPIRPPVTAGTPACGEYDDGAQDAPRAGGTD